MDERSEELALAHAARDGDRAAANELLGRLYDNVYAVCRRICANPVDAEDATQETLISIARALPRFDGRSAVRTWAYRIATNAALDELRRRKRRPDPIDTSTHDRGAPNIDGNSGAAMADTVADRHDIDEALSQLAPEFRAAVVLRDLIGMDYAEIATVLDVPIGTVRSRIARGRRQLAEQLGIGNQTADPSVVSEEP